MKAVAQAFGYTAEESAVDSGGAGCAEARQRGGRDSTENLNLQKAAAAKIVQQARDDAAAGIITKQQLAQAEHAYVDAVLSDEERTFAIKRILVLPTMKRPSPRS